LGCAVLLFPDVGAAKLKTPRDTPNVTRTNAAKIRGLKKPDLAADFLFMI
jgi:hypothetical protein